MQKWIVAHKNVLHWKMFGKLFSKNWLKNWWIFKRFTLKVPNKIMFSMEIVWKMAILIIFENEEIQNGQIKKNRVFAVARKLCSGHTK